MIKHSLLILSIITVSAQMATARCAPITNTSTTDQLLEQVRPEIEYTSTGIYPLDRLLERSEPYAKYDPKAERYHHTLARELELYDTGYYDCGARYRVSFKPKARPLRTGNTFVFNKKTGWLIETLSDESRFNLPEGIDLRANR